MWTVVYVSQTEEKAHRLRELLRLNKIIARVRNSGGEDCYEVLVPQTELNLAQDLIFENEF